MEFKDYYTVLGVPRGADDKAIKAAYRKLARKHHPDVNKDDGTAGERFKEINEAYEVLKDPEKRSRYDQFGADWERYRQAETTGTGRSSNDFSEWFGGRGGSSRRYEYQTSGSTGFSDFFDTLFGDTFGQPGTTRRHTRAQPQRGEDYEYPVEVSLRDAYHGVTRRFDVQIQDRCETCSGSGMNGRGFCAVCNGNGYLSRTRTLEVKIPAGVRTGAKVRVAGQGARGANNGPNGDIYLNVTVKPDPQFELHGNTIRTEFDVPLYTAILGGEARVTTLDGPVELRIPPETQNGQVFRLRGKGMPSLKGSARGDLLARVKVVLPTNLTEDQRRAFEELRDAQTAMV